MRSMVEGSGGKRRDSGGVSEPSGANPSASACRAATSPFLGGLPTAVADPLAAGSQSRKIVL